MVELLLQNSADTNVRYLNSGKTPLFVAVEKGCYSSLTTINIRICNRISCFFLGNERLVNLLLEYYADVDFSTRNGKLPLQKAQEMGNFVSLNPLE